MDDSWERSYPFLSWSLDEVRRMLGNSPFAGAIAEMHPLWNEGKRNTNYRLTIAGSKGSSLLLRVYVDPAQGNRDAVLMPKLSSIGVKAAELLHRGQYSREDVSGELVYYGIYSYIQGQSLQSELCPGGVAGHRLMQEIGEMAARIHSLDFQATGFLGDQFEVLPGLQPLREWYPMFLNDRTRERLGASLTTDIEAWAESERGLLDELDRQACLVHGDYRPPNIIVQDGRLSGVIDWEFAMAGHGIADLGQLLRYEELFDEKSVRAFVEGYETERGQRLPKDWRLLAKLRDVTNLLQMMSAEIEQPRKQADLKRLLQSSIHEWKRNNRL